MRTFTVDQLLDPKLLSKRIAEEKAEADKYDQETSTNQLVRDSEQYQVFVRRLDVMRDLMATTTNPHDRIAYADHIERLEKIVASEGARLGL